MAISKYRIRYYLSGIISVTSLWSICGLFLAYVKFNDMPDAIIMEIYGFSYLMTKPLLYKITIFIALVVGIAMGFAHTFLYPMIAKMRNFIANLLLRFVIFFFIAFSTLIIFLSFSTLPIFKFSKIATLLYTKSVFDVLIYMLVIEVVVGLITTLQKNLGRDYFRRVVRNAYFTPRQEYRYFMFTDLKDSTILVEKMGALLFSSFIQDCFKDFSDDVLNHGGEIYQFVGDEAVITWTSNRNFNPELCVALHFAFCKRLSSRGNYYLEKYGIFPEFRSSIHSGTVSAALVGIYKTEMAYHGGVLNLCSRLQSVCRNFGNDIVVSEAFFKKLPDYPENYSFLPIADIELKGISERQLVYKILQNQTAFPN